MKQTPTKSISRYLLPLLLMTLTACGEPKRESVQVNAPVNALRKCPKLPPPVVGESYEHHDAKVTDLYYACAMNHDALIRFETTKGK